jgi:predicted GNAT family acetyltransferase
MSDDQSTVDVVVTNNKKELRYEAHVGGELVGFTTYVVQGDRIAFNHAEVYPKWEGRGVGSALARGALDDVVSSGNVITPLCPFIVDFVSQNPSYLPNVDEMHRRDIEGMIAVTPGGDD